MVVLGIDTSCDDTSVGIVQDQKVLANVIASQDEVHAEWGGVVPNLARLAHKENIPHVYAKALEEAKIKESHIEAIAVTYGPGLAIALEVGLEFAQQLSEKLNIPLIPINHMEGHLFSSLAKDENGQFGLDITQLPFPCLGILASGKHTEIVLVKAVGEYEILGETVDDAFGEAFDKVGRLLNLGYPGGGKLAQLAQEGNPRAYPLPIAMRQTPDFNVSYSGLKTATYKLLQQITNNGEKELSTDEKQNLAASFQYAAVETVMGKIRKALDVYEVENVLMGGGSAANRLLREKLEVEANERKLTLHFPYTPKLCRDNGAMIALAGELRGTAQPVIHVPDREPRLRLDH